MVNKNDGRRNRANRKERMLMLLLRIEKHLDYTPGDPLWEALNELRGEIRHLKDSERQAPGRNPEKLVGEGCYERRRSL